MKFGVEIIMDIIFVKYVCRSAVTNVSVAQILDFVSDKFNVIGM